jgi:hypothetical protein
MYDHKIKKSNKKFKAILSNTSFNAITKGKTLLTSPTPLHTNTELQPRDRRADDNQTY